MLFTVKNVDDMIGGVTLSMNAPRLIKLDLYAYGVIRRAFSVRGGLSSWWAVSRRSLHLRHRLSHVHLVNCRSVAQLIRTRLILLTFTSIKMFSLPIVHVRIFVCIILSLSLRGIETALVWTLCELYHSHIII